MHSWSLSLGITSDWFSNRLLCGVLCSVDSRGNGFILGLDNVKWWGVDSTVIEMERSLLLLLSLSVAWTCCCCVWVRMCGGVSVVGGVPLCVSLSEWGDLLCVGPVCPPCLDESDLLLPVFPPSTVEQSPGVALFRPSRMWPTVITMTHKSDKAYGDSPISGWIRAEILVVFEWTLYCFVVDEFLEPDLFWTVASQSQLFKYKWSQSSRVSWYMCNSFIFSFENFCSPFRTQLY